MEVNKIILGDCIDIMRTFPDNSIDSIVTDPPYGIGFMGKEWDNFKPSYIEKMRTSQQKRPMRNNGRVVPIGGIARDAGTYDLSLSGNHKFQDWYFEIAKEMLRVLKPGGHLLSFGGSRTYHRMACAIEDAGFEIRDCIYWVYGSGFPKSLNIGKAIDKLQGNERVKTGAIKHHAQKGVAVAEERGAIGGGAFGQEKDEEITIGSSEWEGWGTALKPAHEPIVMARKPLSEKTVAENVLKWGTGGVNVDGSRIGDRFPANLIHDGLQEEWARFFYCAKTSRGERNYGLDDFDEVRSSDRQKSDGAGGDNPRNRTNNPKKNHHPTVKPLTLMKYLIKLVTPPKGIVLDPFAGSGSTLVAAKELKFNFIGIEKEAEYLEIGNARLQAIRQEILL